VFGGAVAFVPVSEAEDGVTQGSEGE
jgi:hypothetical protein